MGVTPAHRVVITIHSYAAAPRIAADRLARRIALRILVNPRKDVMATEPSLRPTPIVQAHDHVRGRHDAPVVLIEYGDYECPYCRQASPIIDELRARLGDRLAVVFRHWPIPSRHPHAQRAAEAAEAAGAQGKFWDMHDRLYAHAEPLDAATLRRFANELDLDVARFQQELDDGVYTARVDADIARGQASGVSGTPAFFINDLRYVGPWDIDSLQREVERPLGVQLRQQAQRFAQLQSSGGIVLLLGTVLALLWANLPGLPAYEGFWATEVGIEIGAWSVRESLRHWVNDALMALFFFVVGLEIKRELLIGELASVRRAALPVLAALGGMLVPALLYLALNVGTPGAPGWGIPVATDIAFTLGILLALGNRVPSALRVFVAALAIADDLGAILVIALFYGAGIQLTSLVGAGIVLLGLIGLGRSGVRRPLPYVLLGLLLWAAVFASGIHPTIAGVLMALSVPARPQLGVQAFVAQCTAVLDNVGTPGDGQAELALLNQQQAAAAALEQIAEQLQTPAQRLEHAVAPWSTYVILPLFALANAGVNLQGDLLAVAQSPVTQGIVLGMLVGKPLGIILLTWLAVRLGLATLPAGTRWAQLTGASVLAGIGFTVALFIADAAFADPELLATAKLGILVGSLLAAGVGTIMLWLTRTDPTRRTTPPPATGERARDHGEA